MATNYQAPHFTIAVMEDNLPILIIDAQEQGSNTEAVDAYYPHVAALLMGTQKLHTAFQSAQFLIWKETGKLPPPDIIDGEENQLDLPF